MNQIMKQILKKVLFSESIYPIYRNIYYIKFRSTGGHGGRKAQGYLKELNESEYSSLDRLKAVQEMKLNKLIEDVYENVPYYRRIMDQRGLTPSDITTSEDLKKLPVLTKQTIKENFEDLLNQRYINKKLKLVETGGTTGIPMKFYMTTHEDAVRSAHWERWKKFAGVNQFDKFMYIGMDENAKNNPKYEGTLTVAGYYLMASFGLDDTLMWKYYKNILKFKPKYLRGYASACYILADFLKRNNLRYPLKTVMTSSDMLYSHQREIIEEVFCCKVFDHYGQNEDIVTATECEYHNGYHVNMESCIVEIVDENEKSVPNGSSGMILGTHLENYTMPLIRYNTFDIGVLASDKCPCGRNHVRVKELFGRKDDIIVTPDGKKIGCGSMNQPMKYLYGEIRESQYIQKTKNLLVVKYVPDDKFTKNTEIKFENYIRDQIGNLISIEFVRVSEIEKTHRGKHRLIISEISE